jgi:hypothetical protein
VCRPREAVTSARNKPAARGNSPSARAYPNPASAMKPVEPVQLHDQISGRDVLTWTENTLVALPAQVATELRARVTVMRGEGRRR